MIQDAPRRVSALIVAPQGMPFERDRHRMSEQKSRADAPAMDRIGDVKGVWSERVLMRVARIVVALSIIFLITSVAWLIGGILGLLPIVQLAISGRTGERTLASVAVASCIAAAIACWKLEKEAAK